MRGLRIAGIVAASVGALLVVALLAAWLLFDPNAHKGRLQAAFLDATGRELRLDGELTLSIFPWLAVETGAASVANRAGFGEQPFAALQHARLGVRLWPLLTARRIEFGPVRVDGLALNLSVARDGTNNWSDLLERLNRDDGDLEQPDTASPDEALSIARLELRDANLTFTDAQAGTGYALRGWDLATGALRKGAPVDVETALRLERNDRPLGRFELRTRIDVGQPDQVALDRTEGTVHFSREGRDEIELTLRSPRIALAQATRDIDVQQLEVRVGEAVLETTLLIKQDKAGPRVSGRCQLADTSPRKLLAALGSATPPTRDPRVLGRLSAKSNLAYSTARGLQFEALEVQLDETRLTGRLGIRDFERFALRFDLRGDALDLDRYLPPEDGDAPTAPAPSEPRASGDGNGGPRALDVRGALAFGKLVVAGIPLQGVTADVRLQDGRFALEPLRARAFGGSAVTRLQYDLAAREPTLRIEQQLAGVDVAAMLGQLVDVRQLQGRGDARFTLTTHGVDGKALFANLRGPFDLSVTHGALIGADLWFEIERAVAAAQLKTSAVTRKGSGRTEFEHLTARGTLADRTLRNEVMEFASDFARVQGRGNVDYGRNALDLDLTARLLKAPAGRLFGVKVSRVQNADIPLRVTGTLAKPQVRPDVSKLLEAAAKDALKQPLEGKVREQLEKIFKF